MQKDNEVTLLSSTVDRLAQCLIRLLAMEAMEAMEVMEAMEAMDLQENDEELAMLEAIAESRMMAVSSSSNANDAQRYTTAGGSVEELLQSGEAWHEEKIADDGFCGFNAAAYLLRHHLPLMYDSDDMLDSKATLSHMRTWLSQALKQDLNLDQMPRSEDGFRPSQADDNYNLRQFVELRCHQVPEALAEFHDGKLFQAAKAILSYIADNSNESLP